MSKVVKVDLTRLEDVTNPRFWPLFGNNKRFEVLMGGAGSGKSVFLATKMIVRCMTEEGHKIGVFRRVGNTLKNSVFAELEAAIKRLGVTDLWKANLTELTWTFIPNGSKVICKGLDDQEKIKSIQGITSIWIEEATEISPKDLKQLNLRLRPQNPYVKQICISFNPILHTHWLKKRFFDKEMHNVLTLKTTFRDNIFLDKEYVDEIMAYGDPNSPDYDPYMWDVYGKGEWGVIGNLVYSRFLSGEWPARVCWDRTFWRADDPRYTIPYSPENTFAGLDFGYTAPTALMKFDLLGEKEVYASELLYRTKMTTDDIIEYLIESEFPRNVPIYGDSADPMAIEAIYQAGFLIFPADKGPGSVISGIKTVKEFRIYTHEDNVNFNNETASYSWMEDKDGNPIEQPEKKNDHCMDAMRYAISTHLRGRITEVDDVLSVNLSEEIETGLVEILPDYIEADSFSIL